MIGPSGAGKSRLAPSFGYEVISSDSHGSSRPRINKAIRAALMAGRSVVVDATHPTLERRAEIQSIAREFGGRTRCVHVNVPKSVALSRSKLDAPAKYIASASYFKKFESPLDECDSTEEIGDDDADSVRRFRAQIPTRQNATAARQNATAARQNATIGQSHWSPMLAHLWKGGSALGSSNSWYLSEKFDGVRAFWDGRGGLWTRGGQPIAAPAWFVESLPKQPLDGELWAGRGKFANAQSAYLTGWKRGAVQFRVFDTGVPGKAFSNTLANLQRLLPMCGDDLSPDVCLVSQQRVSNPSYDNIASRIPNGSEGFMLRRAGSRYASGRSKNLLKIKKIDDAEATVVGMTQGKGIEGIGALVVEWIPPGASRKVQFKVGSGLTDADRRRPPPIGSRVTVSFMELFPSGKPRHPVFKGVRRNM